MPLTPVDPFDRYLDPPDPPRYSECDGCGWEFLTESLHKTTTKPYEWMCDNCLKIEADEELR